MATERLTTSQALRLARRAWNLLHADSTQALALAERAVEAALRADDLAAEGWGRMAVGFFQLYYATAAEAAAQLLRAQTCFDSTGDRAGRILAAAGIARSLWRQGRVDEALAQVLPLRDEGVRVLRHDQLGVLLNTIAGCYSAQGDSTQAFAYMYEALRDARPSQGRGFDTVLHCNLAHELLQIGDYEHALQHVDQGLARCARLKNPRLVSILLINRLICLTELRREAESLPDIDALLRMPADASGRGRMATHFESMAIAALRAGELSMGEDLVRRALAEGPGVVPDERLERTIAAGLLAMVKGDPREAVAVLEPAMPPMDSEDTPGLSLRMRAQFFGVLSEAHERLGDAPLALKALRQWQWHHRAQAKLASRARYQAATLQTELLRLQHRLDENDARRRSTERARAELAAANQQLLNKVQEVQSLQEALRRQATQDPLTRLFNRRHLNDALPTLFALAQREGRAMALVIIDLDHFKRVNDQHGHAAGDRLLADFGELLVRHGRRSDVACRYGGEEFCLLMPRTNAEGAKRKVESLLKRWRAHSLPAGDVTLDGLSFSAGIADTSIARSSPDALLKAADDELLNAKRAGRNQVLVANETGASVVLHGHTDEAVAS
jgi:diguanylate cyclase (GGDEF)-like protein